MIGRLNHVAIAVPDLEAASAQYANTLGGAEVGAPQDEPDHGVTVVFITLPNTKIELLYRWGGRTLRSLVSWRKTPPRAAFTTSAMRLRISWPRATS